MNNTQIISTLLKPGVLGGISFAGGTAFGVGVSAVVLKRNLKTKYEKLSETEIDKAREYYSRLNKKDDFADPVALASKYTEDVQTDRSNYSEIVSDYQPLPDAEAPAATEEELVHVSKTVVEADVPVSEVDDLIEALTGDQVADFETEAALRTSDVPYVITFEEYYEQGLGEEIDLSYFEADGVVTDLQDRPIDDVDDLIGEVNLTKFGQWSKDANMVYIRNEELGMIFSVTRSKGSYENEVLGLRHSDVHRIPKFRREYDG